MLSWGKWEHYVKDPILVPYESGKITAFLGHTGWVAHRLMPHEVGSRCIPPTFWQWKYFITDFFYARLVAEVLNSCLGDSVGGD